MDENYCTGSSLLARKMSVVGAKISGFTNAQAFFVSACEKATIEDIKLVNS